MIQQDQSISKVQEDEPADDLQPLADESVPNSTWDNEPLPFPTADDINHSNQEYEESLEAFPGSTSDNEYSPSLGVGEDIHVSQQQDQYFGDLEEQNVILSDSECNSNEDNRHDANNEAMIDPGRDNIDLNSQHPVLDKIYTAASSVCECANTNPIGTDATTEKSMEEMADFWTSAYSTWPKEQFSILQLMDFPNQPFFTKCIQSIDFQKLLFSRNGPRLSFPKSEITDLERVKIARYFDIDSHQFIATSLAAFRSPFKFCYTPRFDQSNDRSTGFYFRNHRNKRRKRRMPRANKPRRRREGAHEKLHKMRNIFFGQPATGAAGFKCQIYFPEMPLAVTKIRYLTLQMQEAYLSRIIIPSLNTTLTEREDILQHLPYDFPEIHTKANAKRREHNANKDAQRTDMSYIIPEKFLDRFWTEVVQRCAKYSIPGGRDSGRIYPFRNPILLISNHGTKNAWKTNDSLEAARQYRDYFRKNFREEFMDMENSYVDAGLEDMAKHPDYPDVHLTLLPKRSCVNQWIGRFRGQKGRCTEEGFYPWMLTRDARNAEFYCTPGNPNTNDGLSHGKIYAVQKEIFATLPKNWIPFNYPDLDLCGLDDEAIRRLFDAESIKRYGKVKRHKQPPRAKKIRKILLNIMNRLHPVLKTNRKVSYGVRQEFRVLLRYILQYAEQ